MHGLDLSHRRFSLSALPRSPRRLLLAAILMSLVVLGCTSVVNLSPADAVAGSQEYLGKGLDSCSAPDLSTMQKFYTGTPYYYWGIYIGGSTEACQTNVTHDWITTVESGTVNGQPIAWGLLPLWPGPQNPCEPGFGSYISTNTTTAYNQGVNNAAAAASEWTGPLGQHSDTPIVYDLEMKSQPITTTCGNAIQAFIDGWTAQLHSSGEKAGVYTSCATTPSRFHSIAHIPDMVFVAKWDNDPSTSNLCLPSTYWTPQKRHKQYAGGHTETWNGASFGVDSDCANGWVYAEYSVQNTSEGCA